MKVARITITGETNSQKENQATVRERGCHGPWGLLGRPSSIFLPLLLPESS